MDELKTNAETARRRSFWKPALGMLLVIVSTAVIAADRGEIIRYGKWLGWLNNGETLTSPSSQSVEEPGETRKRLLFGKSKKDSRISRTEALWRSQPDDPASFAEYAVAFLSENKKLPPEFLETARRIDPHNAWFTHLGAAMEAKGSVKKKARKSKRVNGKIVFEEPTPWGVPDQARLDRAMQLLREARQQTKCEAYTAEMLRRRQAMLSHGTLIESLESRDMLAAAFSYPNFQLRYLSEAIAAQAWILGETNNAGGFQELLKDVEAFLASTAAMEPGVLLDGMMITTHASLISEGMAPAANRLGMHDEAARWQKISERLKQRKESRDNRKSMVDDRTIVNWKASGGLLGRSLALMAKYAETPPVLTDTDLEPGRMVDHEILSRLFAYTVWLLLIVPLGLSAGYQFRISSELRSATRRAEERLVASDWTWILGAGIVVPLLYVMTINRLTALGGRDYGMLGTQMLMPFAHFMGLLVLWLAVPLQLICWRLSVRPGVSQIRNSTLTGWLAVICAVAFVPVIGAVALSTASNPSETPWTFWLALVLFIIPVIWLAQAALSAVFNRKDRLLDRIVTARMLIPAYALAMLLIISAVPFFKMSEQVWFEKETLMKPDPQFPSWSRYEYQVAVQTRKELREILGMVP